MAGEGALLRKAREEHGWTFQDIEQSIKIRVRYLEALEKEEYDILPGSIYTKGFLRTYAKHLGLDPEEIIRLYNASLEQEIPPETHQPLTPIQSTPVWFKPKVILVMALLTVTVVFGITYFSKLNGSTPDVSDYDITPLPSAPKTQKPNDDNQKSPEQQEPVYEGIIAELVFQENCWLVVRVDGKIAQEGLSTAGTTKVFEGKERIEFLTIGNAGGFTLKLNGKEMPPLGASGEVIYNYVVTEEMIKNISS
ncbi:MAG TPA: helix-turn-helix domain-containing protein [Peptococcaceae bacterium]|nr:helix-turn-helix domain-containing protein [Peptococcaceae bacterium]